MINKYVIESYHEDTLEKSRVNISQAIYNWDIHHIFIHFGLLSVIGERSENESIDVFSRYLELYKCYGRCLIKNEPVNQIRDYYRQTRNKNRKNIVESRYIKSSDVLTASKKTNYNYMKHVSNGLQPYLSHCILLDCEPTDLLAVFAQLVYISQFHFNSNPGLLLADLASYKHLYLSVPPSSLQDFAKELNHATRDMLAEILRINSSSWSLKDAMDIITTSGMYTLQEKAKWSEKQNSVFDYLSSLTNEEENCIKFLKPDDDFKQICHQNVCRIFCENAKKIYNQATIPHWYRLLRLANHPSVFHRSDKATQPLTWLIPFCFHGDSLYNTANSLSASKNVDIFPKDLYGYTFCDNARQMVTDEGLCTTFNPPKLKDYLKEDPSKIVKEDQFNDNKFGQSIFTEDVISKRFDDGLLLILDSWSFQDYVTPRRDRQLGLNAKGTLLESPEKNMFRIILHDQHEVPTLHSAMTYSVNFKHVAKMAYQHVAHSPRALYIEFDVEMNDADDEIRYLPISKRQCRFGDESEELKYFNVYRRENCLFECKIKVAKQVCNCTPWDRLRDNSEEVCDLMGNHCFQKEMLRMKRIVLSKNGSLGSPPCGCYSSCR